MVFCFFFLVFSAFSKRSSNANEHRPIVAKLSNFEKDFLDDAELLAESDSSDDSDLSSEDENISATIENPGSISDPGQQSIVQSESRDTFYSLATTEVNISNDGTSELSPTIIVSSRVDVYIFQINVTEIPTPTPGLEYKFVFFKPGILIGVLGGLLFIIGLIYTICCRKRSTINYAELKKRQAAIARENKSSSSGSIDDIRPKKGKKNSAKTTSKQSKKPQTKSQTKPKSKKSHRR